MNEIDLGPVTVALAALPTGKDVTEQPSTPPDYRVYTDENDDALRDLARPATLSAGLKFFDATLFRSPIQMAIWTYADQSMGRSVTLARTPVGGLKQTGDAKPTIYVAGQDLLEAAVDGAPGARVVISDDLLWRGARTSLVWLKDGSVLQISGRGVTDQELAEIAGSL